MKLMSFITAVAMIAASSAMAENAPSSPAPASAGAPNIIAPYAQAEAYIKAGGAVASAKGIASVSHPATGIYCIQLAGGIHKSRLAFVTVEWGNSTGNTLFAYVQQSTLSIGCPGATVNTIEVRTYSGNPAVISDLVAFNITVP